jgi:2-enoate reductase
MTDYYVTQLGKSTVSVELNKEATPELIKEANADVIFIATGGKPRIPDILGVDKPFVATAIDILLAKKPVGEKVAIIGGGLVGCELAIYLAQQSKAVVIVEVLDSVARDMWRGNRLHIMELLERHKVRILTSSRTLEIKEHSIVVSSKEGKTEELEVNTVAIATGLVPNDELHDVLAEAAPEVYAIGDCSEVGKVINAIWAGFRKARII